MVKNPLVWIALLIVGLFLVMNLQAPETQATVTSSRTCAQWQVNEDLPGSVPLDWPHNSGPRCITQFTNTNTGCVITFDYGECPAQTIVCSSNSECGTSGYVGSPACQNGDVYQGYQEYTCLNAGTTSSQCQGSSSVRLRTDCGTDGCTDGQCNTPTGGLCVTDQEFPILVNQWKTQEEC